MLKLVLWDADGTLVDSQAHIVGSMELAFQDLGLTPPSRDEILGIVGLSLPQAMHVLCPEGPIDALVDGYKAGFQKMRAQTGEAASSPLFPGIKEVLAELNLRDDLVMGIATGKSRRGLDYLVDTHDLRQSFVTLQHADGHPSKPHPSMALTAMAESGADMGVMIGDTTYDLEMGRAAGLKTIAVTWGYHPEALLTSLADCVVHDRADLIAAIDGIWGSS